MVFCLARFHSELRVGGGLGSQNPKPRGGVDFIFGVYIVSFGTGFYYWLAFAFKPEDKENYNI